VYRERERETEKEREKQRDFFFKKELRQKKEKKMPWDQGERTGVTCHPGTRVTI
jgi:hypothetical protein